MSSSVHKNPVDTAIAATERVSSRIEETFAGAGHQLGQGHAIFQDLNRALTALCAELSGSQIEGASDAIQDVARRLNGLAEALPAETALLDGLVRAATEASSLLQPLFKHIQMISIIARSARIEAASLADDREGFLAFTQEAFDLGKSVQRSLEGCASDQARLSGAIEAALGRQKDFQQRYRAELLSSAGDLVAAYSGMRDQRSKSVELAQLAGTSTKTIAEAVGRSIVSLQAGDSMRQRLEHVRHGLKLAPDRALAIVPADDPASASSDASLICRLEALQLKDAHHEFDQEVVRITGSLSTILADATSVVSQGRSLYGGTSNDSSSFLARIRESLAQASTLIATCEGSGHAVDDALALVEETLARFHDAIAGLSDAVADITLIGMNASLKAGHLGSKGNAFVVIANELKATADLVSVGAARLKPALDGIEKSASDLKALRVHGDPAQLAGLEPTIMHALRDVEAGNDRLGALIGRLIGEGAEFEWLMNSALDVVVALRKEAAALPDVAMRLDLSGARGGKPTLAVAERAMLDDLFSRYTMEREREVHRRYLAEFGIAPSMPAPASEPADDGVLLF
jgi:hypothetical protein